MAQLAILNFVNSQVGLTPYVAGSGNLGLAPGGATAFAAQASAQGLAVSATLPMRVVVVKGASSAYGQPNYTNSTIYQATGIDTTNNQLTGLTAIEGTTDRAYTTGDVVYSGLTAGSLTDLWSTLNSMLGQNYVASGSGASFASLAIAGHITSSGPPPAVTVATGAGSGATVSVSGTDMAGTISLKTGSLPAVSSVLFSVAFANNYAAAPKNVLFTPGSPQAAVLAGATSVYPDLANLNATGWSVKTGTTALLSVTTYIWGYQVIG